jgi:hypothetical protein
MHVSAMPAPLKTEPLAGLNALVGRCFMHPVIDYLLVGGGITIPIFIGLYFFPTLAPISPPIYIFLLINGAHFAASTLRLYTKPGAKKEFPFLSWGFPVVCLLAVGFGLYWPVVGKNLTALYFTWSPYHYAAQTYGIAVMYAMRSGAKLDQKDKAQIWWVCLLPFLYALFTAKEGGLAWFVSAETIATIPGLSVAYQGVVGLLSIAVLLLPLSLFWQLHRSKGRKVPLISLLLQVSNGIWWLTTDYLSAFWWTTAFHSVQYLIIVVSQHVKEQMARDNSKLGRLHTPLFHGAWFYGLSFVLAGFLFFAVPVVVYPPLGFDTAQSILMMTVIINLHHFIVDGFIWKNKPPQTVVKAPQRVAVAV